LIDCNTSERTLTELRLSRAYVRLCVIPESSHEIRMLAGPAINLVSAPLFWLELFDHSTNTSVDSFCCYKLKDAAPVFSDFLAQADDLNETGET
jgi:hypothetical protein